MSRETDTSRAFFNARVLSGVAQFARRSATPRFDAEKAATANLRSRDISLGEMSQGSKGKNTTTREKWSKSIQTRKLRPKPTNHLPIRELSRKSNLFWPLRPNPILLDSSLLLVD